MKTLIIAALKSALLAELQICDKFLISGRANIDNPEYLEARERARKIQAILNRPENIIKSFIIIKKSFNSIKTVLNDAKHRDAINPANNPARNLILRALKINPLTVDQILNNG